MDLLILAGIRILEAMFAVGMVFSASAIIVGAIDFARTFVEE
jgi:hypothetical protein